MSAFLFLMLLMLAYRDSSSSSSSTPLAAQAAHAQVDATVKNQQAKTDPSKRPAAAAAQKKADDLTRAAQQQAQAKATPPPWPQAMPPGLPAFPSGWEYDNPPPQAVQNRAWQLLPILWKTGAGSRKTEQTQGRWITYQAENVKGGKKGVVAYRVRPGAPPAASPSGPTNVATTTVPVQRMLRQGMSGPDVQAWQRIIGVTADGQFGPATAAATKKWQASHGLAADGIVGPNTWAAARGVTV